MAILARVLFFLAEKRETTGGVAAAGGVACMGVAGILPMDGLESCVITCNL
jgi:hypothetical protein